MSSYDHPFVFSYNLGTVDFGADADVTRSIPLPLGASQARVLDIIVQGVEAFASTTTNATVQVGRSGDTDAFASLTIPDLFAVGAMRGFRAQGSGLNGIYVAEEGGLAALDALLVTMTQVVDDSADTGQAIVTVVVAYNYVKADL